MKAENLWTWVLAVIIMAMSFVLAIGTFAMIDNIGLQQAVNEYLLGGVLVSLMAGIMFAYAIYESER